MQRDFSIKSGIYLVQPPYELDLHNNFDFQTVHYSVADRTLALHWRRSTGNWVSGDVPAAVCIECREVSEFRFLPRDPALPFTEDDCVGAIGYWTDEAWVNGVLIVDPYQMPETSWLFAVKFQSRAVILVRAASARAQVQI